MKTIYYGLIILSVSVMVTACTATKSPAPLSEKPDQVWRGTMTGMIEADLAIKLWILHDGSDDMHVKGSVEGRMQRASGGHSGTIAGTITGTVSNGKLECGFNGSALVEEGDSLLRGRLEGNLEESAGSGTWDILPDKASRPYSGEWTMTRQ